LAKVNTLLRQTTCLSSNWGWRSLGNAISKRRKRLHL